MRWIAGTLMLAGCTVAPPPATGQPAEPVRFGHLTACVSAPQASADFLTATFGWPSRANDRSLSQLGPASAPVVWVDADGFTLKIIGSDTPSETPCRHGSYPTLTFAARHGPDARAPVRQGKAAPAETVLPRALTRQLDIRISSLTPLHTRQNSNVGKAFKPRVDRIAIIVRNSEDTARFFTETLGLRRHPDTIDLDGASNPQSGGIHVVFVDANGVWLALVQPVGPGPLNGYLDTHGDGVIAELIVEVPDLAESYDRMAAQGIRLVNTRGEPVDPVTKAHVLEPFRDKIAYFPTAATGGLTIELVERGDPATSLLEHRDRGWTPIAIPQNPLPDRARQ